jgi:hypothetical protein
MDYIAVGAAIIGLVNGVRLLKAKDAWGFVFFLCAIAAGLLFGALHWFGLSGLEAGLVAGLISSGFYRVGEKVGGQ